MKRMMGRIGFGGPGGLGGPGARMGLTLASLCLGACIFGGTGSDHENGAVPTDIEKPGELKITGVTARVIDTNGSPIAGVSLYLYEPSFRPDWDLAPRSLLTDTAPIPITDTLGYATLDLSAPGKFVVEGVSAGKTILFDTLVAPILKAATPFTFMSREPSPFRGKVALYSGMRIDSGSVFIRGTSRTAKLDAAGNYDLGDLPSDAVRMGLGVRYAANPTSVQESKQTPRVDTGKVGPVAIPPDYTCKDVAQESTSGILSRPSDSWGADTGALTKEMVDSTQVSRALDACESLPRGSVVNVVSQDSVVKTGQKQDSTSLPMLVLADEASVVSFNGTKVVPASVIPYAGCVPAAGVETTSFDLTLQTTAVKSDILIGDVAAKCLDR